MSWETETLTREELYRLVWERPVQHVAESMGVSDVALGKTCRRLGIPVPGRGYWARKAAGERVPQPPLPKLRPGQQHYHTLRRWVGPEGRPSKPPDVKRVDVTVPEELTDPHPLIRSSLPFLRQAKDLREDLLEREACVAITVHTHALMSRAIRIMDTLLKSLEAHGASVEVTSPEKHKPSQTLAHIEESTISFGLEEGIDRVTVRARQPRAIFNEYRPREEYKAVPTRKIALRIHSYHRSLKRATWADGKRQRVEDCLGKFVVTVLALAETERLERLEKERREAEWQRRRREKEERKRRQEEERARIKDLELRLKDWKDARAIRELADGIERDGGDSDWLSWARSLAGKLERQAIRGRDCDDDDGDDEHDDDYYDYDDDNDDDV